MEIFTTPSLTAILSMFLFWPNCDFFKLFCFTFSPYFHCKSGIKPPEILMPLLECWAALKFPLPNKLPHGLNTQPHTVSWHGHNEEKFFTIM
jgi:hypothetical protein